MEKGEGKEEREVRAGGDTGRRENGEGKCKRGREEGGVEGDERERARRPRGEERLERELYLEL